MTPNTKEVKIHDFRRGDLIERGNLQAIQRLLESFARTATQKFTSLLHQPCVFEVNRIDQLAWGDLTDELEKGMYFFTFSMTPLPGRALFAMPTDEVLALVDLRLAGSGDDDFTGRIPSEIDQAFLVPIIEDLLGELSASLSKIQETVPALETQEGNILFVTMGSAVDMCIAIRMSFYVANRSPREVLFCLPFPMVRSLSQSLQSKTLMIGDGLSTVESIDPKTRLHEIPLDVVFQFPSIMTLPSELMKLEVGDCLGLGHPKGRPLEVRAEGILIATAEICSSGVHKAFEVDEEIMR